MEGLRRCLDSEESEFELHPEKALVRRINPTIRIRHNKFQKTPFYSPGGAATFVIPSTTRITEIVCVDRREEVQDDDGNIIDITDVYLSTPEQEERECVTDEYMEKQGTIDLIDYFEQVRETGTPLLITLFFEFPPDYEDMNECMSFWIACPEKSKKEASPKNPSSYQLSSKEPSPKSPSLDECAQDK